MDQADRQLGAALERLPWDDGAQDRRGVPCPACQAGNKCPVHPVRKLTKDPAKQRQGRTNRRKGADFEREIVKAALAAGVGARKVPLSGRERAKGFGGDVLLEHPEGHELMVEAKRRKAGWPTLERWLEHNDVLVLRRDAKKGGKLCPWENNRKPEPLTVLRLADFLKLLKRGRL